PRLPARLRRPGRQPAALPRRRGPLRRRAPDDDRRPGGRPRLRPRPRPAVARAAAADAGTPGPPGRPVGRPRLDVRAAAAALGPPGTARGAAPGGRRPPGTGPLRGAMLLLAWSEEHLRPPWPEGSC